MSLITELTVIINTTLIEKSYFLYEYVSDNIGGLIGSLHNHASYMLPPSLGPFHNICCVQVYARFWDLMLVGTYRSGAVACSSDGVSRQGRDADQRERERAVRVITRAQGPARISRSH
jgi:hypothetical protein